MADNGCLEPTLAKLAKEKKKMAEFWTKFQCYPRLVLNIPMHRLISIDATIILFGLW